MKKIFYSILVFLGAALLVYFLAPGWILESKHKLEMMAGTFSAETVEIGGTQYHYYDNNRKNAPVVVMLHGFADKKASWLPFVNKFSNEYRIILPDALGHGDNFKDPNGDYSLGNQSEFIHRLTKAIELNTFHLVGISMGGGIAGEYADRFPEDLRSLTFISSAGLQDCETRSKMDVYMDSYSSVEEKKEHFPLLPETYSRANARQFKEYVFHKNIFAPNRLFKEYTKDIIENKGFYISVLSDFVDIETGRFLDPLDTELESVNCPVLIIWGNEDPLLHVSCASVLAAHLPQQPEMVFIENCGHATIAEQPNATANSLKTFLERVMTHP